MTDLDSWTRGAHTVDIAGSATTHPTYRKGSGPGVVMVHEIPALTEGVIAFGQEFVDAGSRRSPSTATWDGLMGVPPRA